MTKKIKIGVLGAGHLGKIHLRLLQQSSMYELVGFYDANTSYAHTIEKDFGYSYYSSQDKLIAAVEVVDIVTPTPFHYQAAKAAIIAGKHVFIEKPITQTVEEAQELLFLSEKYNVKGQVGHVERFNPAFLAAKKSIHHPMFIETHRLAEFNPRGTDVPVVLDLMIHDIDTVLSVVQSKVKQISASGVAVISDSPDIANARIEFENGCVANLTASRISLKNMRKSRFFQKDAYVSIDYLDKKVEIVKMKDPPETDDEFAMILENAEGQKKQIYFDHPNIQESNAILMELDSFAEAIKHHKKPIVTLTQATSALKVAHQIISCF